ncbi:MAG: response regulator [Capsulimonadales bacterium]|nr:response regulator [Capsulimonadales bacterium]
MLERTETPSVASTAAETERREATSAKAPIVSRGKVLVADDEPPLLRLMEFLLVRQGYTVLTALNGEEALAVARSERPDLILLDVMMPRLDGLGVVTILRNDPELKATPILMLTARAQDEDRERGLDAGVDAYVTKPFDPEQLSEIIARFIVRGPASTENERRKITFV